jgi:hypothetical protein
MDVNSLLQWLEATAVATRIREGLYLFPFLESVHVIALALVFGTICVLDLRMLGIASKERGFKRLSEDIVQWTWLAFLVATITGALMFTTNAGVYYHNTYFRVKMLLLLLSGVNMGIFELTLGKRTHEWGHASRAPRAGRIAAILSLALWLGVIFTGRLIGFTTSRAKQSSAPTPSNLEDIFK